MIAQNHSRASRRHAVAPVCALGFVCRDKERTFCTAGEESRESPTDREGETQGREKQTEPNQKVA